MDSSRSLARVIMELQDEIKKLETENKALRGELTQVPLESVEGKANSIQALQDSDSQEGSTSARANLRRNASAPSLEGQFKEHVIMTVRRYSVSSNILKLGRKHEEVNGGRQTEDRPNSGHNKWAKLQDGMHCRPQAAQSCSREEHNNAKDRYNNRRSLHDYVNKTRSKVKTVTFLLPVDDIYTNRPASGERVSDQSSHDGRVTEDSSG